MDEVDIANDRIMQDLEIRLAETRSKERPYGPEFCQREDCGEPMPELRRKMGMVVCVDCASLMERVGRMYRRD